MLLSVTCLPATAQKNITVSGFVKDAYNGETLIGATITDGSGINGVNADNNGYFSIHVKTPATLSVSFVGYAEYKTILSPTSDTLVNIYLENAVSNLDEIVVSATRKQRELNVSNLSTIELTNIPAIGGKPDVSKGLQLLPGISSQNEGSVLLIVRGGDPGQNLYLFDDVPVIHVNHLGGFISVFNPEIINNINLYKGGFPARYGGKLSSIVDITQKEGDNSGLRGSLSLGVTDASFSLEGPTKLKNSSFIVTGRKTMIDALMSGFSFLTQDFIIYYGFHDINSKFTWRPDSKNTFNLNFYYGDDYLAWSSNNIRNPYTEKFRRPYTWGNLMGSAHWKQVINPKLYASHSLSYTRYRLKDAIKYSVSDTSGTNLMKHINVSSVQNLSYRGSLKYSPARNWNIEGGLQSSILVHVPAYTKATDETPVMEKIVSSEDAIFVESSLSFLKYSNFTAGLRGTGYFTEGYKDFSVEPRLNLSVGIFKDHSLSASYMEVNQYSHLVFASGNDITMQDVWVPSDKEILPSRSKQFTIGWRGSFLENSLSAEVNYYQTKLTDLVTFKEGYSTFSSEVSWRSVLETGGTGRSRGVEMLVKKETGDLTGFLSYTLSQTTRQYPGINEGTEYVFDYDRTHALSLSLNYKLNKKIYFSGAWVYQTGLPYTPAIGLIAMPGEDGEYYDALIYGERNSGRMEAYHRLDVGMNYKKETKRGRQAEWNFSVYNLYNRRNPYYYYYNTNSSGEIYDPEQWSSMQSLKLYKMSFFPIIPTVSYKVFFSPYDPQKDRLESKDFWDRISDWLRYD